jgi:hypothetical protein
MWRCWLSARSGRSFSYLVGFILRETGSDWDAPINEEQEISNALNEEPSSSGHLFRFGFAARNAVYILS